MRKKTDNDIVTPFDWQRFTAGRTTGGESQPRKSAASRAPKKLTVKDRVERILAHRWGNPYCRPGAA